MGVNMDSGRFLAAASQAGVSFEQTLTLGRQWLFAGWHDMSRMLRGMGCPLPEQLPEDTGWADDLFHMLGAKSLTAMDNSSYEGAELIHDLNAPLAEEHHGQYDLVYDGGTLEHVFNVPVALLTCMQLVKPGGHLCLWTPSNNEMGHGFYQFSPELFYRVFQPAYGFRVRSMILIEKRFSGNRWYSVQDAAALGARVACINKHPLFIMLLAQKVGALPPVLDVQQADYVQAWREGDSATASANGKPDGTVGAKGSFKRRLEAKLPAQWVAFLKQRYRHYYVARLGNRAFFERIRQGCFTVSK